MDSLDQFLIQYGDRPVKEKYQYLLKPFFDFLREQENQTVESFDDEEVRNYLLNERTDLKRSTKIQILKAVRSFVQWYYAHCTDPENEAEQRLRKARIEGITLPQEEKKEKERKALKLKELEKLLETAKIRRKKDYHVFYLLAYFGFRKSELQQIENVNWREQYLEVITGKTKEQRLLYFNDETAGKLATALENKWTDLKHSRVGRYKSLFPDLNFSLHKLRHTFNKHMRRRLDDDSLVRALMGHSDQSMTDYYDDKFREEIKEAMVEKHYFTRVSLP
ncbi:hypothetical protein AKJ66_00405 [candidate division MSBL1 archaeon SCGC-AAA259E22]|uniref:Tyr recombinase domain-containing protein n=1 Tax=candidate division MSBL1 archaeon SCGC-AAA259E22 TaxID=1698265 RepID=A0A133UI67_9EURY|nr:hypothetical protein AKJ66_00405 [candidate division MSBL1 archaeon SCGC-AAA259E22]